MTTSGAPETSEPVPLYRRISDDLKAKVATGDFRPGDRLPSELELARAYNVSRITSRQALGLLCSQGVVVRRQGMGSFVAARPVTQPLVRLTDFLEDMVEAGLRPESKVLVFESESAPADIAERLGLSPGDAVYRLDRLRLADASPIALDCTWLPLPFGRLLVDQDLAQRTIYGILEQDYGIPIVMGEYIIAADVAGEAQATLLEVSNGAALLRFERTSFTTGDKPIYVQKRFYRADRVQYRLTLQRTAPGESAIQSFAPVFAERSQW